MRSWIMKRYIALTDEGYTYEPDGKDIENLQVLGIAEGADEEEAIDNLLKESPWIKNTSFKSIICLEITGDFKNARVMEGLW